MPGTSSPCSTASRATPREFELRNLAWLETIGAIILGAETYRMFAGYWPTPRADHELIGPRINALPKYVFSRSLTSAPWGDHPPARVESSDAATTIGRIKAETDGDLVLWGSLSLSHHLIAAGAVDSVRLIVVPVGLGSGRGPFPQIGRTLALRLVGSERIGDLVALEFAVRSTPGA